MSDPEEMEAKQPEAIQFSVQKKELEKAVELGVHSIVPVLTEHGVVDPRDKKQDRWNTMTASWGAMGVLWGKKVCFCFII